ncbi:MAG: hypothetical protein M1830_005904 [Pleopsidium flavum]|nr:MAG: hypothetical protein M1830_005904 [Pleopsidium flavum]
MAPGWLEKALHIIFWPLSCLFEQDIFALNLREQAKDRNARLPKPLCANRERKLSVSYDPKLNLNSSLLGRLSPELRLQIYGYVLGGNLIHLVLVRQRIAHVCCTSSSPNDFERDCCEIIRHSVVPRSLDLPRSAISLSLLRSCRQIYNEAIRLLYSANTFDVDDLSALLHFSRAILPQRLASITRLHINWMREPLESISAINPGRAPYDKTTYLQFWRTVATKMPALAELRLIITDPWWARKLGMDHGWVRPLKAVRGLKTFEFDVGPQRFGELDVDRAQVKVFGQKLRDSMCRATEDTSDVELGYVIWAKNTVVGS